MTDIATKFGLTSGGPFGYPFLGYKTGSNHGCPFLVNDASVPTTTATRLYYQPMYIYAATTFNRCYTYNQGVGDNGDTYRTGVYANDGANGPGTLISDFGEVTLTGAAALRTQTISFNTASYVGQWVWLAFHCNQAVAMHCAKVIGDTEGYSPADAVFGVASTAFNAADCLGAVIRYINTTYGALASTAVAPTNGIVTSPTIRLGIV